MNRHLRSPTTVPLGEVAALNPHTPRLSLTEEVAFVPMASVSEQGSMIAETASVADLKAGFSYFQRGDVLVAKITPCYENNKITVADFTQLHGFGSTEFHVLRPAVGFLDSTYLAYFLRQDSIRRAGEQRMTGSGGQRRVPRQFLEDLPIPLPPLDEQRRLAAILDQADDLRRKRRAAQERLDKLKDRDFEETFLRPNFSMGRVADLTQSTQYGTSAKAGEQGAYPILRMGNLTYNGELTLTDLKYIDLSDSDVDRHTVVYNDIIFNRTNSPELVGKTAIFREQAPFAFAGYLVRLRTNHLAAPDYVSGYLNSKRGKSVLRGMAKSIVGMANINAREMQAIQIPLPPLDLQRAFAARVAAIDKLKAAHRSHLAKLDALFASLQHRAFRGEL